MPSASTLSQIAYDASIDKTMSAEDRQAAATAAADAYKSNS